MSPAAATPSVLGRFPSHLQAAQAGKLLGAVVDALAGELEVATNELGAIRRSHRLAEAPELLDLLHLASLHAIEGHAVEILRMRLAAAAAIAPIAADLRNHTLAEAFAPVPDALGVPATAAGAANARTLLNAGLTRLGENRTLLELLRTRVSSVVALHRRGNGTVGALLGAAANALDLDLEDMRHSRDRYWHVAMCRDRVRIDGARAAAAAADNPFLPRVDAIVLEENELKQRSFGPVDVLHGEEVALLRRGYEDATVTIQVTGVGERTLAPMVVNVDTGVGLAFTGSVPGGQVLEYAPAVARVGGKDVAVTSAKLAGKDVAPTSCFAFAGGVFANATHSDARDFVFADDKTLAAPGRENIARFAKADPETAFDKDHPLDARDPKLGLGGQLPPVMLEAGSARLALFVAAGTFAAGAPGEPPVVASPLRHAARFDWSVWDPQAAPPDPAPVARLGLTWREHEPYEAVVWIPRRFAKLDVAGAPTVASRIARLLERHRAAGVRVDVRYVDGDLAKRAPADLEVPA